MKVEDVEQTVRDILEREIRPGLAGDGIDVELVGVRDGIVEVRFAGLPPGEYADRYALTVSILQRLKEDLPELKNVVCV